MLELAMTPADHYHKPAILLEKAEHVAHLHAGTSVLGEQATAPSIELPNRAPGNPGSGSFWVTVVFTTACICGSPARLRTAVTDARAQRKRFFCVIPGSRASRPCRGSRGPVEFISRGIQYRDRSSSIQAWLGEYLDAVWIEEELTRYRTYSLTTCSPLG
jgi:hypothetical protein